MAQNFNNLLVYQESYKLTKEICIELEKIEKNFRLKDQLFGSISSIAANLAEMAAFDNKNQILQKVRVSIGECNEAEFWLNLCKDIGLIDETKHKDFVNRVKKTRMMLYNLLASIKNNSSNNGG
jgi:four helix bundle protein